MLAVTCCSLSGCWLFGANKPARDGQATSTGSDGSTDTADGVDASALAAPEGLPDMGWLGTSPNDWAPAFVAGTTRQTPKDDVMSALKNMSVVTPPDWNEDIVFVEIAPDGRDAYPGLHRARLSFHRDKETKQHQPYAATIHFSRSIKFEPALRAYLLHHMAVRYGEVDDPEDDHVIITDSETLTQVSINKDVHGATVMEIHFPREKLTGRRLRSVPAPEYPPLKKIAEDEFAPPEGLPDGRKVLGLDPNRWAFAFLPEMTTRTTDEEAFAAIEEAGFRMVGRPGPQKYVKVRFVPKTPDVAPGVKLLLVAVEQSEGSEQRTLQWITATMAPGPSRNPAWVDHMVALAELNFGTGDNPERSKEMSYVEDNFVGTTLSMKPSGMEIQLSPPVVPF